jgi:hypothetical protein
MLKFVDDGKKVWKYSSMRVQYVAGLLLTLWGVIPDVYQTAFMDELRMLGFSNRGMILTAGGIWLLANIGARVTKYVKDNGQIDQPPH